MRGIRDAINRVPSKPGFVLAGLVIIGIGGWYYGSTYLQCAEVRQGRELLRSSIEQAARSSSAVLDLGSVVEGAWDNVRIVQNHRPGQVPLNCPFGWDLSWRDRQELIEAGLYTVIGFFNADQFVRYIEYRSDWARFEGTPERVDRNAARFDVLPPDQSGGTRMLILQK